MHSRKSSVVVPSVSSQDNSENDSFIDLFLEDSSNLPALYQWDTFRVEAFMSGTVFEEMDLYSKFDTFLSQFDDFNYKSDKLSCAIRALFSQSFLEANRFHPHISFQMTLTKRLQILDRFQMNMLRILSTSKNFQARIGDFPTSPISNSIDENQDLLLKSLEKAMKKSDVKRGFLAQWKRARHETILKILGKYISFPLSLKGMNFDSVRNYLVEFCMNTNQPRRNRLKAYSSLIYLAIGQGSLYSILSLIQATLSFTADGTNLSDSESEDYGLPLKPEILRILQRFDSYIQRKENDAPPMKRVSNQQNYKQYAFSFATKKPISIVQMFSYLIRCLDSLNQLNHDYKKLFTYPHADLWCDFAIEIRRETFSIIQFIINQLLQSKGFDTLRATSILVLFRILELNVRVLSLRNQKTDMEMVNDLKVYLLTFLYEQEDLYTSQSTQKSHFYKENIDKKVTIYTSQQIPSRCQDSVEEKESEDFILVHPKMDGVTIVNLVSFVPALFSAATRVVAQGFTIFFPKSSDRIQFLRDLIDNCQVNQLKRLLCYQILRSVSTDILLFDEVVLLGVSEMKFDNSLEFLEYLLNFVRQLTIQKMSSKGEIDTYIDSILSDTVTILSKWQSMSFTNLQDGPIKRRHSTIPSNTILQEDVGNYILSYINMVLKMCDKVFVESCSRISEESKVYIEPIIKSVVVKLGMPLLQFLVKLLWTHTSTSDFKSIQIILSRISKNIVDLLRISNSLNIMFNIGEIVPEWQYIETCHPYMQNMSNEVVISFPTSQSEAAPFAIGVKFDHRCITSNPTSHLKITSAYIPNGSNKSPSLQFSGASIPMNPLLSWGDNLTAVFTSTDGPTEWGMKLSLFPLFQLHWLYEYERTLGWIGGRFASFTLSQNQFQNLEKPFEKLLRNVPFYNGLDISSEASDAIDHKKLRIAQELRNLTSPQAIAFVEYMNKIVTNDNILHTVDEILRCERNIVIAILHHSNLLSTAIELANNIILNENVDIPDVIIHSWKIARSIRMWMVQTKQMLHLSYEELTVDISKKTDLLLKIAVDVSPCDPLIQKQQVTTSQKASSQKVGIKNDLTMQSTSSSSPKHDNNTQRTFKTEMPNKTLVDLLGKSILEFIKGKYSIDDLTKVLRLRNNRAYSRIQAFKLYYDLLDCSQYTTVRCEVIKDLRLTLRSVSCYDGTGFHYLNNIDGCTIESRSELIKSFSQLMDALVKDLSLYPSDDLLLSGLLHEILDILFLDYQPCDATWIIETDLIGKIIPLLFNSGVYEPHQNLQVHSSRNAEVCELRNKAWYIFKALSLSSVKMLEALNAEKHKNTQVRDLHQLVFKFIFDELEVMLLDSNTHSKFLIELLRVIVDISDAESSQPSLQSKRFNQFLLPLLRVPDSIVQELTLQLCNQIILHQNTGDIQDEESTTFSLLKVLFETLGSFKLSQIVGKYEFLTQNNIPLRVAKMIFSLLRQIPNKPGTSTWKTAFNALLEVGIHDLQIVKMIGDEEYLKANINTFKHVLATIILLSGFSYIPEEGEEVLIFLNERWESATICSLDESRHSTTYYLKHKKFLKKPDRIGTEFVKTLSDTCLQPQYFNLTPSHFSHIYSVVSSCASVLDEEKKSNVGKLPAHHLQSASLMLLLKMLTKLMEIYTDIAVPSNSESISFLMKIAQQSTKLIYGGESKLDCCSFAFTGKQFTRQYYYSCKTCNMLKTKAVCAYCVQTCHKDHEIGKPELGEFYCDCGAGEGTSKCKSLKKIDPPSPFYVEKMGSILLRYHNIISLEFDNHSHTTLQIIGKNSSSPIQRQIAGPTKFIIQPAQSKTGYSVAMNQISYDQFSASGLSMIGTDYCIPKSWSGFYFEVEIVKCGPASTLCIGLSERLQCNKPWPHVLKSSHCLVLTHASSFLYIGATMNPLQYGSLKLHQGDIIGCGYSKLEKYIFFTRNGKNLGVAFSDVDPAGPFFPTIIIKGDAAVVRTNFGSSTFLYADSDQFMIKQNDHFSTDNNIEGGDLKDQFNKNIQDLVSSGVYNSNLIEDAVQRFGRDANAIASFINRSHFKTLNPSLIDKMTNMGFLPHMCAKALRASGNDIEKAITLLVEGQIDESPPTEVEISESNSDSNEFGFNGSDTSLLEFDQELSRGMLQNPDVKTISSQNHVQSILNLFDLVVVKPNPMNSTRYSIGVITKMQSNSFFVQVYDFGKNSISKMKVSADMLLSLPEVMCKSLHNVAAACLEHYQWMSILFCRKLLSQSFQYSKNVPLSEHSSSYIYKLSKMIFAPQLNMQHCNFVTSYINTSTDIKNYIRGLRHQTVNNMTLIEYLSGCAIVDINYYSSTTPHTRRIRFRKEFNGVEQHIKIFGATSIYLRFSRNCQLQTERDQLLFTYERKGSKVARVFKGPSLLPKHAVIHGTDEVWFHFNVSSLHEGAGFEFYATGATFSVKESEIATQSNLALAFSILLEVEENFYYANPQKAEYFFNCLLRYLLTPFAPYKSTVCDVLRNLLRIISRIPINTQSSLVPVHRLRIEMEGFKKSFETYNQTLPNSLPVFHDVVDLFSLLRFSLKSDICTSRNEGHYYQFRSNAHHNRRSTTCTSCFSLESQTGRGVDQAKYYGYGRFTCSLQKVTHLNWCFDNSNDLYPHIKANINPGDWFEHSSWVDQIAGVRQLCEYFSNPQKITCPKWLLLEAALETKKKVQYRESEHPYKVIKDEGMIRIPGAKTLCISFDKHSQTHKCDKLCFSTRCAGSEDLGAFSGEELKDKVLVVHGNTVYYKFKSDGGNHECTCNNCGKRVIGIRYHCTVCDDFDLCSKCIRKVRVHPETHLFLKIRRPVDCVPASLPLLYTSRWANSSHFRGVTHIGVQCNVCGKSPIVGIRYWCENCDNYNLCEKCAEDDYMHHDRLHVFLRVVRPLPPKVQMPLNALPYGLVYEKELDTHWGYLFSVSSTDSNIKLEDEEVKDIVSQIDTDVAPFSKSHDAELVKYIETHSKQGWQSLEWNSLKLSERYIAHFNHLSTLPTQAIRYRFILIKLLNRKISRVLHLLCFENLHHTRNLTVSHLISSIRDLIFHSVKMDLWNHTIKLSLVDINPISMHLNRHLAIEENKLGEASAKKSLFQQAFQQAQAINPRVLSRKGGGWKVTFLGESADDYGGPFRESLNQICTELQSLDLLDLFIPVPNKEDGQGDNREKFIPNPRGITQQYQKWYHFFGVLIGVGLLSKNVLPLDLPSIFWKSLVDSEITIEDFKAIDLMQYQSLMALKNCEGVTPDIFEDVFFHTFVVNSSEGTEIEIMPNGKDIPVTYDNREEYVRLAIEYKLHEISFQVEAVKKGLYSIIPERYFAILTWTELERLICGDPYIDLKTLKKHTIYEGYSPNSKYIKDFWSVLQGFSHNERSLYLRFVWGRCRLPISEEGFTQPMKIQRLSRLNPDGTLPLSHTCFFSLELPQYSNKNILHDKLLFAITHCRSIDTDAHATRPTI